MSSWVVVATVTGWSENRPARREPKEALGFRAASATASASTVTPRSVREAVALASPETFTVTASALELTRSTIC